MCIMLSVSYRFLWRQLTWDVGASEVIIYKHCGSFLSNKIFLSSDIVGKFTSRLIGTSVTRCLMFYVNIVYPNC